MATLARFGLFRFLFLFGGILALSGSPRFAEVRRTPLDEQQQEYRIYRKSRLPSLVIPRKAALWLDNPEVLVNLQQYLEQDLPDLALFNAPETQNYVIDFFVELTRNEEVALTTLYYSNFYGVSPVLAFSVAYHESRFQPGAVNQNPTSVDRGVFQLNNLSFPRLSEVDFFNIGVNIRHGLMHLDWCLSVTDTVEEALGVYNAGLSRIRRGEYPATTLVYIRRIMNYKETLERELVQYVAARIARLSESSGP